MAVPVAAPPAPTVVVKQPEPVRPYTGTTSYKAYKEYFKRICVCNDWKTPTECARHVLVATDGAASEAVRGLKAEQNSDFATSSIRDPITHFLAHSPILLAHLLI